MGWLYLYLYLYYLYLYYPHVGDLPASVNQSHIGQRPSLIFILHLIVTLFRFSIFRDYSEIEITTGADDWGGGIC